MATVPVTIHLSSGQKFTYAVTESEITYMVHHMAKGKPGVKIFGDRVIAMQHITSIDYPPGVVKLSGF